MAHRIDHATAAPGNLFTEGDPLVPTPPTRVTDDWLNDTVQEEICNSVEDAGMTLDKADNNQLALALEYLGANIGMRNKLINGAMRFWQRGKSFNLTSDGIVRAADRWAGQMDDFATGTVAFTRVSVAHTAWDLSGEVPKARWALKVDNSGGHTASGGSNDFGVLQKIEDVRTSAGKKVTASFKVRANKATTIKCDVGQNFGTGGSPSATVWLSQNDTVNTAWKKVSFTFDLADLSGKTLGSNNDDSVVFYIYSTDTSGVWFEVTEVQFEEGRIATVWEDRPEQAELALCQRYYEKSYDTDVDPGTVDDAGAIYGHEPGTSPLHNCQQRFMVPKRVSPTITWYSPNTGASGKIYDETGAADRTVSGTAGTGEQSTGRPGATGMSTDPAYRAHFTADAEF